ncbi:hypothetical protein MD484_g4050, partial [Candolleomyces efflorescens]
MNTLFFYPGFEPELRAKVASGTFGKEQDLASGQGSSSAAENAMDASELENTVDQAFIDFDQAFAEFDQTMKSHFGGQTNRSGGQTVPAQASHGRHPPSRTGNTPWTESQFAPRPLQAEEQGTRTQGTTAESIVPTQAELDEEWRRIRELIKSLREKEALRTRAAAHQSNEAQTTETTLANPSEAFAHYKGGDNLKESSP